MIPPWYQGHTDEGNPQRRFVQLDKHALNTEKGVVLENDPADASYNSKCLFSDQYHHFLSTLNGLVRKKNFLSGKLVKISFITDLFLEVKWNCSQNQLSSPPSYYPPRSWWTSDDRGLLSYWSADMTSPVVFHITGKQRDMTLFSSSIILRKEMMFWNYFGMQIESPSNFTFNSIKFNFQNVVKAPIFA